MAQPAKTLEIRTSPHITSGNSVDTIMFNVVLALLPATLFAVWVFGLTALLTLVTALVSCLLTEHEVCRLTRKPSTVGDWSVTITGLLYGLTLPPGLPPSEPEPLLPDAPSAVPEPPLLPPSFFSASVVDFAWAEDLLAVVFSAITSTAPSPASTIESLLTTAALSITATLTDRAPAIPTLFADAPLVFHTLQPAVRSHVGGM